MPTRREALKSLATIGAAVALAPSKLHSATIDGVEVNDVQSRLNATRVRQVLQPNNLDDIQKALRDAKRDSQAISVCGGRHAMGTQQFATDGILIDTNRLNRVIHLDREKGVVSVEAGIQWPDLIASLNREQKGQPKVWSIREKQTGVDRVSLGGSLASNIHGRGLTFPPMIHDIESFQLLDAAGKLHTCSRKENTELFSLAIGGYGLFGIVTQITLRLVPRTKIQRIVEIIAIKDLLPKVQQRIKDGFEFGDCQYSTDLLVEAPSHAGVFSCYRSVPADTPIPDNQKQLSGKDWADLYGLARTDKKKAFERYSQYYVTTNNQIYWSDTHQLAGDFEGYRQAVKELRGTEMITEVYVSHENFVPFMAKSREDFIAHNVDMTYGTIRFIEADTESFLLWAKHRQVCIVCNLHVLYTDEGKKKAADDFRRIIDRAIEFGGRFYLTYHRWARRDQVEKCYPQFVEFLKLKRKYDPDERFQSTWYRHYREMFADKL